MSRTYRGTGKRIRWTNGTGSTVSSGDIVVIGSVVGVAIVDIADGSSGIVEVEGDHALTATTAEAWGVGALLYADVSASNTLTADPDSGDVPAGFATVAKAASVTTGRVALTPLAAVAAAGGVSALDWQDSVKDLLDFTSAEPAGPSVGDRYLNSGSGSSSETSQTVAADEILIWNGTDWTRVTPSKGMATLTEDDLKILVFTTSWVELGTPANIKDLTDAGNADTLHVHTVASGITDTVTVDKTADAIQDALPTLNLSAVDGGDGTAALTVQAKDAADNDLAEVVLAEIWVGTADDYGEDAITGITISTGTQREELTANAAYRVISDATGKIVLALNNGGAGSVYAWAVIDGKVCSSGEIVITSA